MYEIIWSPIANTKLIDALNFTIQVNHSNSYAVKLLKEIQHIESLLMQNELLGSNADFPNVRKCIVLKKYSLFYTIDEHQKQCHIIYFWDNRQNPKGLEQIFKSTL